MGGGNVIFYIFLAIMIVLLIRWTIRVFFTEPKAVTNTVQEPRRRRARSPSEVRRTTVYTISADHRANDPANNFTDFFWDVSPQTSSARDQSAKDDKDLPSYDEVMQMEMRQQVIGATATAEITPHGTSLTPVTPMTTLTPVTQLNIVPSGITASTV